VADLHDALSTVRTLAEQLERAARHASHLGMNE
jgi:hypothetical protein